MTFWARFEPACKLVNGVAYKRPYKLSTCKPDYKLGFTYGSDQLVRAACKGLQVVVRMPQGTAGGMALKGPTPHPVATGGL